MARVGWSVLGAGAGAYGMQQYNENGISGVWGMLPSNWAARNGQQAGNMQVDSGLQNELRRLTGMMNELSRSRPTVVQVSPHGGRGWTWVLVPTGVGCVVLYAYCKLTGNSIWDLFYVSRSSMAQFRATMQDGLAKVWEEMRKQKDEVFKVITGIGKKQDELGNKQDVMDERLRRVDATCEQLDGKASHTIEQVTTLGNKVERMDDRLQDVHSGVTAANQGIFMLVSAVSEVTQRIGLHNSRTAKALKAYAEGGPAWGGTAAQASLEPLPAVPALPPASPISSRASPLGSGNSVTSNASVTGKASGLSAFLAENATSGGSVLQPFSIAEVAGDGAAAGPDGVPEPSGKSEAAGGMQRHLSKSEGASRHWFGIARQV